MKWLDHAERRFGHLAIPGLLRLIVGINALVFVLYKMSPYWLDLLALDPGAVRRGEVWRLVTYIFIPAVGGPIADWLVAALYLWYLWWLGDGLEEAMGSFRLNVFYFAGMIGTTVAAFFFGANFSSSMLNASLFFAFARFFPEMMIYLMALVPVKVKWLAWFSAAIILIGFVFGGWGYRFAVLAALGNYFLFFGKEVFQEAALRRDVEVRRRRFASARHEGADEALHRCSVCGRTDATAPELDFRVAKDGQEYCLEHLPKAAVQ
jgi:membrane associated rhomboid family serine protease